MGDSLEIRVARHRDVPVAAILTLRFRKVVYYKYACSDMRFKKLAAMPLLLWEAIRDSKIAGAEEFDFGRSETENKGLITFKDHWVNDRTELVYWRYPAFDSVTEGWKLQLAKRVFARMPLALLPMVGRVIYSHIG